MTKRMLIDASHAEETRVVVLDGTRLEEFDLEAASRKPLKGNIYLAKVVRVEPSLQAAFVEYGGNRHGFLAFSEIHPDYYQIPVADRQRLLEMQAAEAEEDEEEEREARPAPRRANARGARAAEAEAEADGVNGPWLPAPGSDGPDPAGEPDAPGHAEASAAGGADQPEVPPAFAGEAAAAPPEPGAQALDNAAWDDRAAGGPGSERQDAPAPAADAGQAAADPLPAGHLPSAAPAETEDGGAEPQPVLTRDLPVLTPALAPAPGPTLAPVLAPVLAPGLAGDAPVAEAPPVADHDAPPGTSFPTAGAGQDEDEEPAPPARRAAPPNGHAGNGHAEDFHDRGADGAMLDADEEAPPETIGGEDDAGADDGEGARERRIPPRFLRHYKIQEVIRRRQIMLVQVVKEERGTKGAALTTYISLAGRFSVLMPNSPRGGGVSRKITSATDRKRLREAIDEVGLPQGMSLIVRTAGAQRPKPEIRRDCEYLLRLWDNIRERTLASTAPALIYEEADLIKRSIRDVFSRDVEEILVDGEDAYQEAREFMRMLMPQQLRKIQLIRDGGLFARSQVEQQLEAIHSPVVQLRSGGYIVINQTEALVAIDVNSGRATRDRHIEDTALRTNLEASDEIARQLRLRDLAGLIVIDFIDMESGKHDAMVERRLKDALKHDRARIQVGRISHFGLLEMSRQRLRPSLGETAFVTCPHCQGRGHVRSVESSALMVLRAVEDEAARRRAAELTVHVATPVALYLLNRKRDRLAIIEERFQVTLLFEPDETLTGADHRIERTRAAEPSRPAPDGRQAALRMDYAPEAEPEPEEDEEEEIEAAEEAPEGAAEEERAGAPGGEAGEEGKAGDGGKRRRRRRRRRTGRPEGEGGGVGGGEGQAAGASGAESDAEEDEEEEATAAEAGRPGVSEPGEAPAEAEAGDAAAPGEPGGEAAGAEEAGAPRRRRRRGRSRSPRPEGSGAEPVAEPEAPVAPAAPPVPRYLGPTPADPFAGQVDDIYAAMEAAEAAFEAAAASRIGAAAPLAEQPVPADPAPPEPGPAPKGGVPEGGVPEGAVPEGAAPEGLTPGGLTPEEPPAPPAFPVDALNGATAPPAPAAEASEPMAAEAPEPAPAPNDPVAPAFGTAAPPAAEAAPADPPSAEPPSAEPAAADPVPAEPLQAEPLQAEPVRPKLIEEAAVPDAPRRSGWWRR